MQSLNPQNKIISSSIASHGKAFNFALLALGRAPIRNGLAIILLSVLLLLATGIWLYYKNMQTVNASWENSPKIILYLTLDISEKQAQDLLTRIQHRPDVAKGNYISPAQGMHELTQHLNSGEQLAKLASNPLPAVLEILPISLPSPAAVKALAVSLKALPQVSTVYLNEGIVKRQYAYHTFVRKIVFTIVGLLALIFFLSFINIMHLAANDFSLSDRRSFFYFGIILGLLSALVASLLMMALFAWFSTPLQDLFVVGRSLATPRLSYSVVAKLLLLGIIMAVISTWIVDLGRSSSRPK